MSSVIELQAQQVTQVPPRAEEAEGVQTHETDTHGPHTSSVASPMQSVDTGQHINDEAQQDVSQVEEYGGSDAFERNVNQSHSGDRLSQAQGSVSSNPNVYPDPRNRTSAPLFPPYSSQYGPRRSRRGLSVGPSGMMGYTGTTSDSYHDHLRRHPSGHTAIKFRLKGSTHSGISVSEALDRVRLSQANAYLMHDISMDMSNKISLRIRWSGYGSNLYSIPLSSDYHGYVDIQSLARRTSRAIVHFMQMNGISLSWDRVVVHRLEETSPGLWIPVLSTR